MLIQFGVKFMPKARCEQLLISVAMANIALPVTPLWGTVTLYKSITILPPFLSPCILATIALL